jgi:hypothetical protein
LAGKPLPGFIIAGWKSLLIYPLTVVGTFQTGLILVDAQSPNTMPSIQNGLKDPKVALKQSWTTMIKILERSGLRAAMRETKLHTLKTVLFSILFVLTILFSQATLAPPSIGTPQ